MSSTRAWSSFWLHGGHLALPLLILKPIMENLVLRDLPYNIFWRQCFFGVKTFCQWVVSVSALSAGWYEIFSG